MMQTIEYLKKLKIPHQLLFDKKPYCIKNSEYRIEHDNYIGVTGIKVKNGITANENINLYTFDIDCKRGLTQEGKQLYKIMQEEFPELKETYHELTKSFGYHLIFLSDYKTDRGKQVFVWPYNKRIEKPPILEKKAKLEIEFLTKEQVTMAPTVAIEDGKVYSYIKLNENPLKFIETQKVEEILKRLREVSESFEEGKRIREQGNYTDDELTLEEERIAFKTLEANGLRAVKKGNYIYVYHDNKQRVLHITDKKLYIWRWSDQSRTSLKDYVESLGREFKELSNINRDDERETVSTEVEIINTTERASVPETENTELYKHNGVVSKVKLVKDFLEKRVDNILRDCFRLNDSLYKFNGKYWQLIEPTAYQDIIFNLYSDLGVIVSRDQANELVWVLNRKISQVLEYDFLEDNNYRNKTAISFLNGTLYFSNDEEVFKKGQWDPEDRCFIMLEVEYHSNIDSHNGIVTQWFNAKFNENEIEAIKCFMGDLLITQSRTESLLYFVGNGGRGKSTLREAIQFLLPKKSYTSLEINEWKGFRLKDLIKSPLNFMSEINEKELKNSDMIKKMISREHVCYEYKGVDSQMGRPLAKHIAIANELPKISLDGALNRRFHFIQLKDNHVNYEGDFWSEFTKDRLTLARFFIEGIRILRKANYDLKGYLSDVLGSSMKIEMLESHNLLAEFIEECIEFNEDTVTASTEIYRRYEAWYSDTLGRGRMKMTQTTLSKYLKDFLEVSRYGGGKIKRNGIMVWQGIKLKDGYNVHK